MPSLSRSLPAVLCALVVAGSLHAADQSSNASGTLKVNGRATTLRYAYAFRDASDGSTRVLIASKPLPAATLASETALSWRGDPSPFRDGVKKGEASAIELFVKPDGVLETVLIFDRGFEMPTPASGDEVYWYEPYRMPNGWTGGRSRTREQQEFFDTKWEFEVAYFAPLGQKGFAVPSAAALEAQRKEVEAREKSRIVAPGGGEEGAMYLAFYKSMEAGNVKALLEQMTPAMKKGVAEQMQVPALSNSDLASWATMHGVPPGKVEIVGGVRDPEGTLLELRKTTDTRVKFGTAKIVKDGGRWKVAEENW